MGLDVLVFAGAHFSAIIHNPHPSFVLAFRFYFVETHSVSFHLESKRESDEYCFAG
jgi:hypothetical protein